MKHLILGLSFIMFAGPVFAASKAKPLEIDTVFLAKRPGGGYHLQYSAAGRDDDGRPLVKVGDVVPLINEADKRLVKHLFDMAAAKAKPLEVVSVTLALIPSGAYLMQVAYGSRETTKVTPQIPLDSKKDRKEVEGVFALARRARTGKG